MSTASRSFAKVTTDASHQLQVGQDMVQDMEP
jgi:hypothetical protein